MVYAKRVDYYGVGCQIRADGRRQIETTQSSRNVFMHHRPNPYFQSLRMWIASWTGADPSRRRRLRTSPYPAIAAHIELLESRQLLTVTYHGGALLPHVEAQAVYLGSDWATDPNPSVTALPGQLDQFVATIVDSPYMDMLTNAGYNVGRGTATAGVIDNIGFSNTGHTVTISGHTYPVVTDLQIQADIQAMIKAGQVQAPDANRLYVVYVQPGVAVSLGSMTSYNWFLGYHGAFAGKTASGAAADIRYAVIPYPSAPNFTASQEGFASILDELTEVSSHEIAEAVTDPNVNYKTLGWYDDQLDGEIADLTSLDTRMSGYLVQDVVNKQDQPISPPAPPTALSSGPQNVSISATSTTSALLKWSLVSGATGYRVFQVNGTQSTQISNNLSSTTTSFQISSGLSAGGTYQFQVEAYNSFPSTADSQVVSVTMPTAPPLAAPQNVTARASSTTSVALSWSSVSGAQGYRVYGRDNNNQPVVLLTISNSRTTRATISGLKSGTVYQYMIEAFKGSSVGDSGWVSVTTKGPRQADPAILWMALGSSTIHVKQDAVTWVF